MSDSPVPEPESDEPDFEIVEDQPKAPAAPTAPAPASKPQRSRFRRWGRRLLIVFVALPLVVFVFLLGARTYFRHTGQNDLNAEVAKLDSQDPGWRWEDMKAEREKTAPSAEENSAVMVNKVRSLMPKEWNEWVKQQPSLAELPPLNRLQRFEDLTRDDDLANATREARDLALKLSNYPRGYHQVVVGDLPFLESMEETQGARSVAHLLKIDGILAAQDGDPTRGLLAACAIINTGRSIGDEPSLMATLVRFACDIIAIETAMRVLAVSDSKRALPELIALQKAIYTELNEPILLAGLRGERAITNRFFEAFNTGRLGAPDLTSLSVTSS
jgi:hypothetical protein